jgi:hypothetical protein
MRQAAAASSLRRPACPPAPLPPHPPLAWPARRAAATSRVGHFQGYLDVPARDEEALMEALAKHGPVAVAVDASQESFRFYSEGVYSDSRSVVWSGVGRAGRLEAAVQEEGLGGGRGGGRVAGGRQEGGQGCDGAALRGAAALRAWARVRRCGSCPAGRRRAAGPVRCVRGEGRGPCMAGPASGVLQACACEAAQVRP